MQTIVMKCGGIVLVDDSDYDLVCQYTWHRLVSGQNIYAYRNIPAIDRDHNQTSQGMHRLILGVFDRRIRIDHQNHNGLDNQRSNLRLASPMENSRNARKLARSSSAFKGVGWNLSNNKWQAYIRVDSRKICLGHFAEEVDAARAYDIAALEHFGEFAWVNNV